jgi:p-hydroxybenzoate 3-monooxygenase
VSDVHYIFTALNEYYESGSTKGLSDYSKTALDRVWKTERFSGSLTNLLHHFPQEGGFNERIRQAEFDYLCTSEAFQTSFSEGYVGLPY